MNTIITELALNKSTLFGKLRILVSQGSFFGKKLIIIKAKIAI